MVDVTFRTRLRGSLVRCHVSAEDQVHVDVIAESMKDGLERVSRFAGYCSRTLELTDLANDDVLWACAVADYYGFGLNRVVDGRQESLIPPAPFAPSVMTEARRQFRTFVLSSASDSAVMDIDSAHAVTS